MHDGKRFKSDTSPEFSMSPTEISSTTSLMASPGMSPLKDEKGLSDYDTTLSLLTNNPPEQRLDVHLPYSQYLKLEDCWSKTRSARNISDDQKYPYLAYNTDAEIVTVVTVPRALHKTAAVELGPRVVDSARKYLSSHVADASLVCKILNAGSSTTMGSYGNYDKSKKQATEQSFMIAIEVGYSENYTALCQDKDAWIDGQHVKVCLLRCQAEMEAMGWYVAESVRRATSQGYYGCIEYRGHKWVGDLHEAFIEVWRANKRQPIRYVSSVTD
ncbi:hypothetical protein V1522DRAFT_457573 [Lipomyces starkeyi]